MKKNQQQNNIYRLDVSHWYIQRLLFLIAGVFIVIGSFCVIYVSIQWIYFIGFIGILLCFFGITGYCPMAIILHKLHVPQK